MALYNEGIMSLKSSVRRSPLFYVGDKYKLIEEIREHFPKNINTFVEPFLGGGSVFLNIEANTYLLNDVDENVISLHKFLLKQDNKTFVSSLKKITKKYNLSRSFFEDVVPDSLKKKWGKTYYAHFNKEGYQKLKAEYNNSRDKDPLLLYVLLIYGFNRMLRFNKQSEFNIPVGNVDLNKNVTKALDEYFSVTKNKKNELHCKDFKHFLEELKLQKGDFVYVDPPYLISASEYNKLWNEERDLELMSILDKLNKANIKFAMSNVTSYRGQTNKKLVSWAKRYNIHKIRSNYISYHNNSKKDITEVLITNYDN
jgi:DNA adenine methylase